MSLKQVVLAMMAVTVVVMLATVGHDVEEVHEKVEKHEEETKRPLEKPKVAPEKWAVVTGGNKGIGLAVVKKLCADGYSVLVTVRDEKKGDTVRREANGCVIEPYVLDYLSMSEEAVAALKHAVSAKQPRHLVLNAAMNSNSPWSQQDVVDFVTVNYKAPSAVMSALLPVLPPSTHLLVVISNYGQLKHVKSKSIAKRLYEARSVSDLDEIAASYLDLKDAAVKKVLPYAFTKNLQSALVRIHAQAHSDFVISGVHPGSVLTTMNTRGKLTPDTAAEHICNTLYTMNKTGTLYHLGKVLKW